MKAATLKSAEAAAAGGNSNGSDLGEYAREMVETRPYVAIFSAMAIGYLCARITSRLR